MHVRVSDLIPRKREMNLFENTFHYVRSMRMPSVPNTVSYYKCLVFFLFYTTKLIDVFVLVNLRVFFFFFYTRRHIILNFFRKKPNTFQTDTKIIVLKRVNRIPNSKTYRARLRDGIIVDIYLYNCTLDIIILRRRDAFRIIKMFGFLFFF